MDDAYVLRKAIQGALADCIDPLTRIIHDEKAASKDRIHAFEALADRGGLPAVKATIAQTISGSNELDSLKERREKILTERDQLKMEIAEIRKVLPQPAKAKETTDAVDRKREEDQEGDDERVWLEERERSILRESELGEDQGYA